MFDILRSVTFIATFASRAKSIAHVHDVHESLMFLPDCTLAFRGIFSSENREAKGNSKIHILDILCCDASCTWMAFDQTLLTTTLVFALSNDLLLKQMICFGQDCFVFTVNDISFTGMNFSNGHV